VIGEGERTGVFVLCMIREKLNYRSYNLGVVPNKIATHHPETTITTTKIFISTYDRTTLSAQNSLRSNSSF